MGRSHVLSQRRDAGSGIRRTIPQNRLARLMKAHIFISFLLCSCVGPIKYSVTTPKGTETLSIAGIFGGSEALETASGLRWTGNRNKSFGQGAQAVTAIAGGIASASVSKAKEVTTQVKDTNATNAAVNASNNATKQAIETTKINSQTELLKANPQAIAPAGTTLNAP